MSVTESSWVRFSWLPAHITAFANAALATSIVLVWPALSLLPLVLLITFGHVLVIALPLFLILRERSERWINAISSTASGFAIGTFSGLFLSPSFSPINCRIGGVPMVIDGALTSAAWLNLAQFVAGIGAAGALGGLSFWVTLKLASIVLQGHGIQNRGTGRCWRGVALGGFAALALVAAASGFGRPSISQLHAHQPYCGAMVP
jgi:hypothetical protein